MNTWPAEEFLQDFLIEAHEHLDSIRQHLLALETAQGEERVTAINELFRSFHTLKGLSGMIGLEAAADFSHTLESLLKAVQRDQVPITPELIDLLLHATERLEAIIHTLEDPQAPLPDTRDLRAQIENLLTGYSPEPPAPAAPASPAPSPDIPFPPDLAAQLTPEDIQHAQQALAQRQALAVVRFTPTPQWAEQGITVSHVRDALSQAGKLLKATPWVHEEEVRFLFLLALERPTPLQNAPYLTWEWLSDPLPSPPQGAEHGEEAEEAQEDARPTAASPGPPAAPAAPPAQQGAPRPATKPQGPAVLRVDMARMDALMRLVGELIIAQNRLSDTLAPWEQQAPELYDQLREPLRQMIRHLRQLRSAITSARLVPLAEVFQRMPLVVREVARAIGKKVTLRIEGADLEVDKVLADRLLDPMIHLVRNAITHGIEPPTERRRSGKPETGLVVLRAQRAGENICIAVQDDGRGLALEKIAAKAHRLGLLPEKRAITPKEALEFITQPGFSTREEADRGAGRGVGMDVVASMVRAFRGSLDLETTPGQGTTFILSLPLTLAIVDTLLIEVNGQRYAVPRSEVDEVLEVASEQIVHSPAGEMLPFRGRSLPVLALRQLFGQPPSQAARHFGLLVTYRKEQVILTLDRLVGLREVVVHPLNDPLVAVPGISGATELGDGRAVLLLNLADLLHHALRRGL